MDKHRSKTTHYRVHSVFDADWGLRLLDKKGRHVGMRSTITVRTLEAMTAEELARPMTCYWDKAPGTYYCLNLRTLRDGETWGPVQSDQWFTTMEDLQKVEAVKLEAARKRYVRQFGLAS